jgi:putative transposase
MIEDGKHLLNCLRYVDMNMVRAGVVEHPRDWRWCGYAELSGQRKRYRVINFRAFERAFGRNPGEPAFAPYYRDLIEDRLGGESLSREPMWTECLAVGGRGYVEAIMARISNRMRMELIYPTAESEAYFVKERKVGYA